MELPPPLDGTALRSLATSDLGARWVVALLHDGITWWPSDGGVATRPDHLVIPRLGEWLGREVEHHATAISARDALIAAR